MKGKKQFFCCYEGYRIGKSPRKNQYKMTTFYRKGTFRPHLAFHKQHADMEKEHHGSTVPFLLRETEEKVLAV